jgi:hypothetical protein
MPDDLLDRLTRLAPTVDEEAGLATLGGTRNRRVLVWGTSLGLVTILLVVAVLLTKGHHEKRENVTAGLPTTTASPSPLTASTVQDGIELTVTLPAGQVEAGERLRAEFTIRNLGPVPVYWTHGGCPVPVSVVLAPAGAPVGQRATPVMWDGVMSLAGWLGSHNALAPEPFVDPRAAGVRSQFCTLQLIVETIVPGGETHWTGVTDARMPPGSLTPREVVATFVGYTQPGDYPSRPRPPVELRIAVPVLDDSARAASADAAIAAFAADGRLQPFLDRTRHELDDNPVPVTQSWSTDMSWWQNAWELWVLPRYNGDQALRLRYDPAADAVVDARLVSPYQPPGDDPDHNRFLGQSPDTLLR